MKKWFYERNDYFLNSKVNVTFEEILDMTPDDFKQWCHDVCDILVENWDKNNIPPVVGLKESEIIDNFNKITGFNSELLWDTDELTGERNVIRNKYHFGSGVNQFFPTMFKTRITVSTKTEGRSIYDFFSEPSLFESFYKSAIRNFKHDSFYHYSECIRLNKNETEFKDAVKWVKAFESSRSHNTEYDYWLNPIEKDKTYTGYNKELFGAQYLLMTEEEFEEVKHLIPERSKNNAFLTNKKSIFQVRKFKLGQKLFPIGMKCFKIAYGRQVAVNFPPMIAKALYEKYTEHLDKSKQIVIYDPSMGWGGRILGAMTVKDDRKIHYIGTDPNTDHNTENGRTKYHELADFVNTKTTRGNIFSHANTYEIYQLGSEEISKNKNFQKWKGKVDLVFTSPPYFAKEVYSDDEEQSCHKFKEYESWRDGFLRQTLETAVAWLKNDRYLLWNIADAEFDGVRLPLEEDSSKILKSLGMQYIGIVKMALASMPGANRLTETDEYEEIEYNTLDGKVTKKQQILSATTKNACKLAGRVVKYEPIFIWRKS